jgi:hypothetical protein
VNHWVAIVLIVAIWGIVQVLRAPHGPRLGRRFHDDDASEEASEPPAGRERERELKAEIALLRERLEVLERITTDAESREARERRRLESEIDSLRGQD